MTNPSQMGAMSFNATREFIKENVSLWLYLSLLGMSVPVILFELLNAYWGIHLSQQVKDITLNSTEFNFNVLLEQLWRFIGPYFGMFIVLCAVWGGVYLTFVKLSLAQSEPLVKSVKDGVLLMLRKGLLVLLCVMLLVGFMRGFIFLFFIASALSVMIPVLLVKEPRLGVFAILKNGLMMRYAERRLFSKWSVLFQLVSYSACLFLFLLLVDGLGFGIMHLDEYIGGGRGPYATGVLFADGGEGVTFPFLIALLVKSTFGAFASAFFAIFTGKYYGLVTSQQLPAIQVNV